MSNKSGRVRLFKYEDGSGRTEYSVIVELGDGNTYEGKAYPNVGKGDRVYWGGNLYKEKEKG